MRFGISTYACAWAIGVPDHPVELPMDVFAFLEFCAQLQAEVVQVADNLPLHRLPPAGRSHLRRRADELGLSIEVGARGMTPSNLSRYLEIATEMGSPILRMVIDGKAFEPAIPEIVTSIRHFLPELEHRDVRLAIENHDRFRVSDYLTILGAVDSPRVGICLDTVNSMGAGEGVKTVVDALAEYTVNLHVKDYRIRRVPSNLGFTITGACAGTGQLPVEEVVRTVASYGRCGSAILENWAPLLSDMNATVTEEASWTRRGAAYLRELLGSAGGFDL